jgi:integrase
MKRNQFGNVRKLPSGRFQVRYKDPQGNPKTAKSIDGKSLTFETDKAARIYLLHLQSDQARGVDPYAIIPSSADTLQKRVQMYLDPLAGSRLGSKPLRLSTARNYHRLANDYLFRQIDDFCLTQMPITAITRADVRRWHTLIQATCTSKQIEIKSRAHPARTWARSMAIPTSMHGRIDGQLIQSWIEAGAPMIKNYKDVGSGAVQLAQAYRFLRAIFNVAIDDGIIKENPCRIKGAGTPRHAERPIINPEQIASLAAEVPTRYSILVILAAYSSIRSSELLGLQRKQINELQSIIKIEHQLTNYASDQDLFVPPKTDAGIRDVPITKELMAALIQHIDQFVSDPSPDALIFTTSTGLPLFKGRKSWFVTAKRRLGLDHLHFHDLRHTGQSLAMVKGANTKDLQRRAGQSSEAAARIYMHGSTQRDRQVAESLSDYVNESLSIWRAHA